MLFEGLKLVSRFKLKLGLLRVRGRAGQRHSGVIVNVMERGLEMHCVNAVSPQDRNTKVPFE